MELLGRHVGFSSARHGHFVPGRRDKGSLLGPTGPGAVEIRLHPRNPASWAWPQNACYADKFIRSALDEATCSDFLSNQAKNHWPKPESHSSGLLCRLQKRPKVTSLRSKGKARQDHDYRQRHQEKSKTSIVCWLTCRALQNCWPELYGSSRIQTQKRL